MYETDLEEIEPYVLRMQNTFAQYFVILPILELCDEAVQRSGKRV